jgi:apolipoprotein D and lipocalin family protein
MKFLSIVVFGLLAGLVGCSSPPPIQTASHVDLDRFMGGWYVIANIPTFLEVDAHNAVESYARNDNGSIATTFTFLDGGFDGERKTYRPTGFIKDGQTNALWGMQFIWPIKADYRIVWLDDGYTQTAIGRNKRDYVWIMARTPTIPEDEYQGLLDMIAAQGYDLTQIQNVPQRWEDRQK